ncbi:MAG: HEAT repeat domain-containing protein [Phycisphaerales bacterium]|nr:MAG: HEAT repeat domain-containing protein [Phycisphaerales bacterium]
MKLLVTAVLLSANLLAIASGNERELRHQGKTLNEWIERLHHKDVEVRRSAARTLEQKGPEAKDAIPALIEVLEDKDEYVRAAAARALGNTGPEAESAIPALMQAIKDQIMIVRMGAAMGLGGIGPRARNAIPALAEALQSQHEDHNVKREAAEALGKIGPEAVPALAKALQHNQYFVRRVAARALGETGVAGAVPALIKALQDEDRSVRWITAQALGRIGSEAKEAIPALTEALQDEFYHVRWNATRSRWLIRTGAKRSERTSVFPHGEPKDGLAAFLLCQKHRFEIGEPIPLCYGIILVGPGFEHVSEEAYKLQLKVWRPWSPVDPNNASWFEVTGPDGASVPYGGLYVTHAVPRPSDEKTVLLRYGECIGRPHLDLCGGGAFHLNESGIYKVRWFYEPLFGGGLWSGKLASNELQVEILADREAEQSKSSETAMK